MTGHERHAVNLFVLRDLKRRYNLTPEEMAALDYSIAELAKAPAEMEHDFNDALTLAESDRNKDRRDLVLYEIGYYHGRADGIQEAAPRVYSLAFESGQKSIRRKGR